MKVDFGRSKWELPRNTAVPGCSLSEFTSVANNFGQNEGASKRFVRRPTSRRPASRLHVGQVPLRISRSMRARLARGGREESRMAGTLSWCGLARASVRPNGADGTTGAVTNIDTGPKKEWWVVSGEWSGVRGRKSEARSQGPRGPTQPEAGRVTHVQASLTDRAPIVPRGVVVGMMVRQGGKKILGKKCRRTDSATGASEGGKKISGKKIFCTRPLCS
jgi:hypothetical protein